MPNSRRQATVEPDVLVFGKSVDVLPDFPLFGSDAVANAGIAAAARLAPRQRKITPRRSRNVKSLLLLTFGLSKVDQKSLIQHGCSDFGTSSQ